MVRPAEDDLLEDLAKSPLSGLSRILNIDIDEWLPIASSPLPITMRVTPGRHDIEWTRAILESIGGEKSPGWPQPRPG